MDTKNTLQYTASRYENGTFYFTYIVEGRELVLNLSHTTPSRLAPAAIEHIGFNLGMCYLMDLAEIMLPRKVTIYKRLPSLALAYWSQLYADIVVEKCYVLQLPASHKNVEWVNGTETPDAPFAVQGPQDHAALCLTGGKESLAILKTLEHKKPLLLFFLNLEMSTHRRRVYEAVKDAHPTIATISNREDLFVPLKQAHGGLHSGVDMAHLVFNTMLYADTCAYVLIGNEYSSNFPNDIYQGCSVNHQYVKTIRFAENLNAYIQSFVTKDFAYHSPFFGLYELKIADLLFKDDRYLDVWTSCNQTTDEINFCSNCHKCAFTYLVARTKKPKEFLDRFFSRDLLADVILFKPLMDFAGVKPLDCVGDKTEVWVALEQLRAQGVTGEVIRYYEAHIRLVIADDLPAYIEHITGIQEVPVSCPRDVQQLIYDGLGSS